MACDVRAERADPRALAAIRATTTRELTVDVGVEAFTDFAERWCRDNGRRPAGVNWEVYGDWDDDPAKRRTDVYFLLEALAG